MARGPTLSVASVVFAVLLLLAEWLSHADASTEELDTEYATPTTAPSSATPPVVTAAIGGTAFLKCRLNLTEDTMEKVTWGRQNDNHLLSIGRYIYTNDQRFRILNLEESGESLLMIRPAQIEHSGDYECSLPGTPRIRLCLQHLSVIEPKMTIVGEPTRSVMEGDSVILTCIIKPKPPPAVFITWMGQRQEGHITRLSKSERINISQDRDAALRSTLVIKNISMTDGGFYICNSSEVGGIAVFSLEVIKRPTPEVTPEICSSCDGKTKLDQYETEETRGLNPAEIQRLLVLKQLEVLRIEKEILMWKREQILTQNGKGCTCDLCNSL